MKFLVFLPIFLAAASAAEVRVTLQSAPAYAVAHNPDLRAAALRIDEARGRLLGSGRLKNPEAFAEFSRSISMPEGRGTIGFEQRFPVTARLRLEKAISARAVEAAEAELRNERRKLVAEVEAAAIRLASVGAFRALRQEQAALAKQVADTAISRSATGELSSTESVQSVIDREQTLLELRLLDASAAALEGELKTLLGLRAGDRLNLTGALPDPEPLNRAGGNRADLERLRIEQDAADLEFELARARKWDDVGVGLMLERSRTMDMPEGFTTDTMIGLRFSLPLPLWDRNEGEIAEKSARRVRARSEREALSLRIGNEAATARAEMLAQAQVFAETRGTLLPLVRQQTAHIERSYAAGEADLLALLRARDQRFRLQATALEALREYHLARARYRAATGSHSALRR